MSWKDVDNNQNQFKYYIYKISGKDLVIDIINMVIRFLSCLHQRYPKTVTYTWVVAGPFRMHTPICH